MTQCNGNQRARVWSVTLALMLAAGALASCGGSSKSTHAAANATTSASSTSPSTAPSEASVSSANGTGGTPSNGKPDPSTPNPIARASNFVVCMRAHGINIRAAEKSSRGSATLDFRGIDTQSAKYRSAIAACAPRLVSGVKVGKLKERAIPLAGIHVRGLHLTKIRVKGVKLPALHIPSIKLPNLNLPPIHVTTPTPNVHVTTPAPNLGGKESGNEPPTTTQGSTG